MGSILAFRQGGRAARLLLRRSSRHALGVGVRVSVGCWPAGPPTTSSRGGCCCRFRSIAWNRRSTRERKPPGRLTHSAPGRRPLGLRFATPLYLFNPSNPPWWGPPARGLCGFSLIRNLDARPETVHHVAFSDGSTPRLETLSPGTTHGLDRCSGRPACFLSLKKACVGWSRRFRRWQDGAGRRPVLGGLATGLFCWC